MHRARPSLMRGFLFALAITSKGIAQDDTARPGEARTSQSATSDAVQRCLTLADAERDAGAFEAAERLYRSCVELGVETLGEDDPSTLMVVERLALLLASSDLKEQAEPLFQRLLNAHTRAHGTEHVDTIRTTKNLGFLYKLQGKFDKSADMYQAAVTALEKSLGPDDIQTLKTEGTLTTVLMKLGRLDEAESRGRSLLARAKRALGPDHPDTLGTANNLAMLYQAQGRHAEAVSMYEQSLETCRRAYGNADQRTQVAMINLAYANTTLGHYSRARPLYEEALDAQKGQLGEDAAETIWTARQLAVVYINLGRLDEAEARLRAGLLSADKVLGPDHRTTLEIMSSLAFALDEKGAFDEALSLYRRVLLAQEQKFGAQAPETISSVIQLVGHYLAVGKLNEAELELRRARAYRQTTPDGDQTTASTLELDTLLAQTYVAAGRYSDAEPLLRQAKTASEATVGPRHHVTLAAANTLAHVLELQGRYAEAETLYVTTQNLQRESLGEEHRDTLFTSGALGTVYHIQGRYEAAEDEFKRTLSIRERVFGAEHPDTLRSYNQLAELYIWRGRLSAAEPLCVRPMEIQRRVLGATHPDTLYAESVVADLYSSQGRHAEAEPLFEHVVDGYARIFGSDNPTTLRAVGALAVHYMKSGRLADAEQQYLRALRGFDRTLAPQHIDSITTKSNLADLYTQMHRFSEAEELYRTVISAEKATLGDKHVNTLTARSNLAGMYSTQARFDDAERLYRKTVPALAHTLGDDHPATLYTVKNHGRLQLATGRIGEAIRLAERLARGEESHLARNLDGSERDRQAFFDTFRTSTDFLLSLHFDHAPDDASARRLAAEVWTRRQGRVLDAQTNTVAAVRRGLDDEGRAMLDHVRDLRARQARLMQTFPGEGRDDYRDQLQALDQQVAEADRRLAAKSRVYAATTTHATLAAVQRSLPRGGALVQYAVFRPNGVTGDAANDAPRIGAFLLRDDGRLTSYDLGLLSEVAGPIEAFRQTHLPPLGALLHQRLVSPLEADLQGVTRVVIAPDGPLSLVPFAALAPAEGPAVLDTMTLTYVSAARDLLRDGRPAARGAAAPVVVAGPDFGDGDAWTPLPGARDEAGRLAALLPGAVVHTGSEATVDVLRALRGPRILHLATHGFAHPDSPRTLADDNPMVRSGLVFAGANTDAAGGQLLASEAATLDLDGTELVVLSACESGLGAASNGEGVYGMRRALTLAGARNQVVSLWPVNDAATAAFMEELYRRVLRGEPLAEAMRATQLTLRASDTWRDPVYWAPWVLAGTG